MRAPAFPDSPKPRVVHEAYGIPFGQALAFVATQADGPAVENVGELV